MRSIHHVIPSYFTILRPSFAAAAARRPSKNKNVSTNSSALRPADLYKESLSSADEIYYFDYVARADLSVTQSCIYLCASEENAWKPCIAQQLFDRSWNQRRFAVEEAPLLRMLQQRKPHVTE